MITLRPSTKRGTIGFFLLLASTVFCPDAFAQPRRADQSERPAAARGADSVKPDTPSPPAAAKPSGVSKTPGTAATVVNLKTIEGLMGKSVRSGTGNEDMGHIVDLLVDGGGQVRAAVIDFGGFLGVGSRKVAVAWKTLDFTDSIPSGSVKVALTRDQIRQAPEYKDDEPVVILEGTPPPQPAGIVPSAGHNAVSPAR